MRRFVLALSAVTILSLVVVGVVGCSSSSDNPSGPETEAYDYHIEGFYFYTPPISSQRLIIDGAYVSVRQDSSTGSPVPDATVTLNGEELVYDGLYGAYTGVVSSFVPGEEVTLGVSDGIGTASASCMAPLGVTGLQLAGGVWDVSSAGATNTITWTNPATVGEHLVLELYDYEGVTGELVFIAELGDPEWEDVTISNGMLWYYGGIDLMMIRVSHVNEAAFIGNPEDSSVWMATSYSGWFPTSAAGPPSGPPAAVSDWGSAGLELPPGVLLRDIPVIGE